MNWFEALTGLESDLPEVVRAGIHVEGTVLNCRKNGRRMAAGRLLTPALAELPPPPIGPERIRVREVVADARALHADPMNAGAAFQVASQFNLLEMINQHIAPDQGIARYAFDRTQGPACAMACAAGTIWRNYFVPLDGGVGQTANRQLDMLADLGRALGNAEGVHWAMRNGYAMPRPGGLGRVGAQIARADRTWLKGLVRVGVQEATEVTLPEAGHLVHQIYASALPVAYGNDRVADWEPFARLVLEAAYLATFGSALAIGARRLYLTRLGGGVFGNPQGWITDAMAGAIRAYRAAELDVQIVSHGSSHPANRVLLT